MAEKIKHRDYLNREKIQSFAEKALQQGVFPGIEILLAQEERILYHQAFGRLEPLPDSPILSKNALFDLASLTKPLATTFAILKLLDQRELELNTTASSIVPEWSEGAKSAITIKQLLTHTSGLPDWVALYEPEFDREKGWHKLMNVALANPPGSTMIYSCLDFIILGEIIRRVSGTTLANFCDETLFQPLGLRRTTFHPDPKLSDLVPTGLPPENPPGIVDDKNSRLFGGEAGNAGLFSCAEEILKLSQLIHQKGCVNEVRILSKEVVELLQHNHNPTPVTPHSLGWDYNPETAPYKSCGERMPTGSLGHLGFTGTSLWLDPISKITVILLSNRVRMGRHEKIEPMKAFRPAMHNLLLMND